MGACDFRPISLVGSLYKLPAKKSPSKQAERSDNGVGQQSSKCFYRGKVNYGSSLIANEVIDSMVKKKEKGLLCKLDIEKAYDHINWKFLFGVLQEMGFRRKWVK